MPAQRVHQILYAKKTFPTRFELVTYKGISHSSFSLVQSMRARKWEGILILSLGGEPSSNNMRKEIGDGTIAAHSQRWGASMMSPAFSSDTSRLLVL
jgi:hypothetical protein